MDNPIAEGSVSLATQVFARLQILRRGGMMRNRSPMRLWHKAGMAAVWMLIAGSAQIARAESYPTQIITLVVPFSGGGVADIIARIVAENLRASLGKPVIVENKPGAGSNIGTAAVARSAPDGYTLLMGSPTFTINPSLYPNLPWGPVKSFQPIGMIGIVPNVFVVNPSIGVDTLRDFVTLAKRKPGDFSFASAGAGSSNHLAAELLKIRAGIDMVHVPYKGQPEGLQDVLAGRVQFMAATMALVQPYIHAGQLKALAITTSTRSNLLPAVPTVQEAGISDYEVQAWYALFAPAGTPSSIVRRLNSDLNKMLALPDVAERLRVLGLEPRPGSPDELAAFVVKDHDHWGVTIKKAGIKLQ